MKSRDYSKYGNNLSFIDMLFAMLLGVFALFVLSTMIMGTPQPVTDATPEKAQLLISMSWSDKSTNDIDLWVLNPLGHAIGYNNKEDTFMGLERDDYGIGNDFAVVDGVKVYYRAHEEITRIRQIVSGRYTVNAEFYAYHPDPENNYQVYREPEQIKIILAKTNPYTVLFSRIITLTEPGQQKTAFAFDLATDGTVTNFSTEDNPFVGVDDTTNDDAEQAEH